MEAFDRMTEKVDDRYQMINNNPSFYSRYELVQRIGALEDMVELLLKKNTTTPSV